MSATIKDIARETGLGISTVSRALNGTGSASKETKEKVMKAVRELGYVPNSSARNLKKGTSKTIMVVVKSVGNPFFQKVLHEMESLVFLRGFSMDIRNVSTIEYEMPIAMQEARNCNPCGIILLGGAFGYTNEDFKNLGAPCVLVTIRAAKEVDTSLYSSVVVDDVAEMKKATDYLLELGHTRIGCIYNTHGKAETPNSLRVQGYRQALKEHGIEPDFNLETERANFSGSGYEVGFNTMKVLMANNPDMTAVVAIADLMAVGAAKAALMAGKRIPEDISIIGFDGIEESEYYNPALDTIAQPAKQMALSAMEALVEMMKGGQTSHVVLPADLIRRGSCRKL